MNSAPPMGAKSHKDPELREAWDKFQAKYGEKPKGQREIKKSLDKDDFLRIMITQMQHQDPTKPFEADKLANEIAQITSVEQMKNMNQTLEKLTDKNRPSERMAMTNLIGKVVTVDRNRFPYTKGTNETISFTLPEAAEEVAMVLISDKGEVVLEKKLGSRDAGANTFSWDGKKTNGLQAESGNYMMTLEAVNKEGQAIQINTTKKAPVIGVSFDGTEPVFLIGDSKQQERITMANIAKIEDGSLMQMQTPPKSQAIDIPKAATGPQDPISVREQPQTSPQAAASPKATIDFSTLIPPKETGEKKVEVKTPPRAQPAEKRDPNDPPNLSFFQNE